MTINSRTSIYGVIGDPVTHSMSPVMHNSAFAHTGYNGVYLAFGVKDIASGITGIRGLGIKGASITIPHKVSVMNHLDYIDEQAKKIGAVNTVVHENGKLSGFNTDCLGAVNALLEKTDIKGREIVMIGAGGAARAIGFGILSQGGKLTIFNIIKEEGENLARDLGVEYYPPSEINRFGCQILINATPVGMMPDVDAMPVSKDYLKKNMVVMDIVYNPIKTKLLKEAEDMGCITVDGVSMFVYQGVAQFEMWTGQKAPVDLMRQVVIDALKRS